MFDQDGAQDQPAVAGTVTAPSHAYIMPGAPTEPEPAPMDSSVPAATPPPTVDPAPTSTDDPLAMSMPDLPPVTSNDDLLSIKQEALHKLSPLLPQLDQPPEERFKTTMMMIQAADDQSLIKSAYESANEITDEKARAQALLDVVNEINYFTQQQSSGS